MYGAVLRILTRNRQLPAALGALMVNERGRDGSGPVTFFGPDLPFPFDDWISHPAGLGSIPAERHGEEVAVIGAGISGLVAAYELMRLGIKPVVYEASRMGGRLRSQPFEGAEGVIAELGGMRFPVSSTSFYHYVDMLGLATRPFPNPLTETAGSTVDDRASCGLGQRAGEPAAPRPADRDRRKHGHRPGGRHALCPHAGRPSSAVHRGRAGVGAGPGGCALQRHPGRDPHPRRRRAEVVVERSGAPLG